MEEKVRFTFEHTKQLPMYIDSCGYNNEEQYFFRPEGYPTYHWLQTIDGVGDVTINGETFELAKGEAVLITPYLPHSYQPHSNTSWSTTYLTFGGPTLDPILTTLEMDMAGVFNERKPGQCKDLFECFFIEVEKANNDENKLSATLYHLLLQLRKTSKLDRKLKSGQRFNRVLPMVEYLEHHYHENIGLNELANHANLSSQYINTLFHQTFSMSPYRFLVMLRIREAKRMLVSHTSMTVKDISEQVGFHSASHFVTTFKQREKLTPKQYRIQYQTHHEERNV